MDRLFGVIALLRVPGRLLLRLLLVPLLAYRGRLGRKNLGGFTTELNTCKSERQSYVRGQCSLSYRHQVDLPMYRSKARRNPVSVDLLIAVEIPPNQATS